MSLLTALIMAIAAAPSASAADRCDRYAAPFGSDRAAGSLVDPVRTAQRLANGLEAGQTGCLLTGTYDDEVDGPYVLNVRHGGRRGAPLTIRSAPGQRARLRGIVIVPKGSNHVTLSDLDVDGRRAHRRKATGIQIEARDTILEGSDITNHGRAICAVLGYPGYGRAVRTIVRGNVFHDCGGTRNQLEHSLYVDLARNVLITDNVFLRSGTYAIHLFPSARRTIVSHNVMVDNGGGVIFAGEGRHASSGNIVTQNIITGTYRRPAIHSWWGGAVGRRNVARDNCLSNATPDIVEREGGFTAAGNAIAAPAFRAAASGDYRLAAGSPCLAVVGYDTVARLQQTGLLGNVLDAVRLPRP